MGLEITDLVDSQARCFEDLVRIRAVFRSGAGSRPAGLEREGDPRRLEAVVQLHEVAVCLYLRIIDEGERLPITKEDVLPVVTGTLAAPPAPPRPVTRLSADPMGYNPFRQQRRRTYDYVLVGVAMAVILVLLLWALLPR